MRTVRMQWAPVVSRPAPRTRRRCVLSAAAALTVLPLLGGCSGPPPALRDVGSGGTTIQRPVGSTFTYGFVVLYNDSDAPIEIRDIRPDIKGSGLDFLGAQVLAPDWSLSDVDCESGLMRAPVASRAVGNCSEGKPSRMSKLPVSRLGDVPSIKITYRQGSDEQSMTANLTLAVCTDQDKSVCPPEYGAAG